MDHGLVHCDLKPENILLKQKNKSGIKIIDYGSSCFVGQRIYTYIQSRFYRAPEIILGIPYTMAIDMWSFGAIIAELYTGFPLFPGESEVEQLAYIMEIYGVPPKDVLQISSRKHLFFQNKQDPILQPNSRGKIRYPSTKNLEGILRCSDKNFLDFLSRCFEWHPVRRMTPLEALKHPWILEGLPENYLKYHLKIFNTEEKKTLIEDMTHQKVQGFPKDKKDATIH
jgi:dual specificity tyrosine-phosphorylation-regulated kinase 2/3/4